MSDTTLLGESRLEFAARLEASSTFTRWVALAPQLSCGGDVNSIADVFAELAPRSRHTHHDVLLGGLLQLAAPDGGNDQDAVLAVLHAVAEGISHIAWRRCEEGVVLGELTIQIRTYPWRERQRAVAANLLRNTMHAVCSEHNHAWMRTRRHTQRVSEDVVGLQPWFALEIDEPTSPAAEDDLELVDLLVWAERTGVVDAQDLSMLVEYHYGRDATGAGHQHVARLFAVTERTSKRRCAATLKALRTAAPQYLAC